MLPDERELGQAIAEAVTNLPENVYDASKAVPVGKTVAEAEIEIDEKHKDLKISAMSLSAIRCTSERETACVRVT